MGFGGEGQQPAGHEHAIGLGQDRREIGDIHHGIGREDEFGAGVRLAAQAPQHVGDLKLGVEAGGAGPLDHARRQIDADEAIDVSGKRRSRKPGAAAKVDGALEEGGLSRRPAHDSTALNNRSGPR